MADLLAAHGVRLDGIYHCPHVPDDRCACRKPGTGLVERASRALRFDPRAAFIVGDKPCDIELGRAVGATTILVRTGYGAGVASEGTAAPDHIVNDMGEAALAIERLLPPEAPPRSLHAATS
jgi:histidinol phosphatase-like enzyme